MTHSCGLPPFPLFIFCCKAAVNLHSWNHFPALKKWVFFQVHERRPRECPACSQPWLSCGLGFLSNLRSFAPHCYSFSFSLFLLFPSVFFTYGMQLKALLMSWDEWGPEKACGDVSSLIELSFNFTYLLIWLILKYYYFPIMVNDVCSHPCPSIDIWKQNSTKFHKYFSRYVSHEWFILYLNFLRVWTPMSWFINISRKSFW